MKSSTGKGRIGAFNNEQHEKGWEDIKWSINRALECYGVY